MMRHNITKHKIYKDELHEAQSTQKATGLSSQLYMVATCIV